MNNALWAAAYSSDRPREIVRRTTQRSTGRHAATRPDSDAAAPAELSVLAASLAHEVRNALGVVKGAVEVLESDYPDQSEKRHVLQDILRRVDDVNSLVGDLLECTKPTVPRKKDVHLLESLEAVLNPLTKQPRLQCITIVKEYHCDPVVWADPYLLERLFLNLTLNAVQAMKFCGELIIRVAESRSNLEIAFIDKGCGMEREVQERMFGPFFTTKASGSGLGLFMCKKYVEAHNGRIEVTTEAGSGSTFTVLLPGSTQVPGTTDAGH